MPKACMQIIMLYFVNLLFSMVSYANDQSSFNAGFDQGMKTASSLQGQSMAALKNFKPEEVIKNYSDHPKETQYQNNPDAIKTDAAYSSNNDPTAKAIGDSISNHPKFDIKPDSPFIQNISKQGDNVYDIVTGQYGDCTKKTNCETTYQNELCDESQNSNYHYCKKTLTIDMIPHQIDTHYYFTMRLKADHHDYAGATVNAVTGKVNFKGPSEASLTFSGRLPASIDCQSLHGTYQITDVQHHTFIDTIAFPNCSNGLTVTLHITGKDGKANLTIQIDMVSSQIQWEPKDQWNDQCDNLSKSTSCTLQNERCLEENTTHIIQGIPVTRACWEWESSYLCGSTISDNLCQPLRDKGCEQIDSVCKEKNDVGCALFQQTFRCPIKECKDVGMICNGQTYCLDGDCVNQDKQADPDFQKAVSALSATFEASKNYTEFNSIFAGVKKTCDKLALGFLNCCANDGWGKDINLAQCSQEEQDLGVAKENLQTVYVGEYCKKDPLGICLEHRKAYCVFPSKLARIIQAQGRRDQLHIGFGDPEHVNCRGLTQEEFAVLNLEVIDFSDFYPELTQKEQFEDPNNINQRVTEKADQLIEDKTPNG